MRWMICFLVCIVLPVGCYPPPGFPPEYMSDPLYCTSDEDCASQATACNNCGCPEAVNKYNVQKLRCEPSGWKCDLYCLPTIPKCIDNKCTLQSKEKYCETDTDCTVYCCQSCGNKEWAQDKYPPEIDCCSGPPIAGCVCINNSCEQMADNNSDVAMNDSYCESDAQCAKKDCWTCANTISIDLDSPPDCSGMPKSGCYCEENTCKISIASVD